MSSLQLKKSFIAKVKSKRGSEEGRLYEKLSLLLLAKRGYELSKHENSEFRDFAVGREIGIGKEEKFDDVVFSYIDHDMTKNLIFLQVKHKQDYDLIDSQVLSTEAIEANNMGGVCRDFNLQKYFISYLSVRDELKLTKSEELKDGKIKYVALFTNIGLHTKELNEKGFSLREAPDDIVNLFALKKPSSETQRHCYQLRNVSEDLRKILEKSSDLDILARELAKYVVWENYRENSTMGIDKTPIKHYHFGLGKHVIKKSDQVKNVSTGKKKMKTKQFCEAQFKDDFLDCDETVPHLYQLRNALFDAIRDLDESKKDADDDELKRILKAARWKTVPTFGKNKQNIKPDLPWEWTPVKEEDITEFLQYLVFIVEQPKVTELEMLYKSSIQGIVVGDTALKQFLDKIYNTGPEFRNCIEKVLERDTKKTEWEEKWIFGEEIQNFIEEKKQLVSRTFLVSAMTHMYKYEVMQYGKFNDGGKIIGNVDSFLKSDCNILCINTQVTLLSSIKLLQHMNTENDLISVSLDILNYTENRDSVLKAFELERNSLLTIECRHAFKDEDIKQFFYKLFNIAKRNSSKLILIMQKENYVIFTEHFKTDFQDAEMHVIEKDYIDLKHFEPKEDPIAKKVLVFQGQKEKISLSDITGINNWNSYVDNLSEETNEQAVIDGMTLIEILSNDEIELGSKPLGTSSLEGAYLQMYEEINLETLANKLMSQEHDNDTNDIYIISGISGLSKQNKIDKLIQYLGQNSENEELINRLEKFKNRLRIFGINNLQLLDDQFKDSNFKEVCDSYPEKRIFWICVKRENVTKFILQEIYNPKFYLKRNFENTIIEVDLKEYLIKDDLSEILIIYCAEGKQMLYESMELNEHEIETFEASCMIKIFSIKSDAEDSFKELSKQNETVHLLEFEEEQFVWWDSHGSLSDLRKYIDDEENELFRDVYLIEEDNLIKKIKDRKVVVIADDPGMGKTTTLIKLYETENESYSIMKSHWVIGIKLRNHLQALRNLECEENGIDIVSVVDFLSKIDLKLNSNLAKNLLATALVKSKKIPKSLLLTFDGFDEVLSEDDRNRILLLIKFLKNNTSAKLWVTTRCHFKSFLEQQLSTVAVMFVHMDDSQKKEYITEYLKVRLYLTLSEEKYEKFFYSSDEKHNNEGIDMYIKEFLYKLKSTFQGTISTFIGTPLQLYLMLEGSARYCKNWILNGDDKIPDFNYIGNDVLEVYEYFIDKKYDVYLQKVGIREGIQKREEKINLNKYHKDFVKFTIFELKQKKPLDEFLYKILLAGIIKADINDPKFIHKTFEEFFAAKVFIRWIQKEPNIFPNTKKQEYVLKQILMKSDYELIRTFMNLQLQKMAEQALKNERQSELDKSYGVYGNIIEILLNEEDSPLIDENGTPLHIAVHEGNKDIACFLLKSLKGQPDILQKFLFIRGKYEVLYSTIRGTALHLACTVDDVEVVVVMLEAAAGISESTLQEFLKCETNNGENALHIAANNSENERLWKELLNRVNDKLHLILFPESSLCEACLHGKETFVTFLLQEFKDGDLKQLLLHNDKYGNALYYANERTTIVEKLIAAAKSIKDDNKTLRSLLLPEKGLLPFIGAISNGNIHVVEMLLNVAKDMNDKNYTLTMLLLGKKLKFALHVAAEKGRADIIKLLLQTAEGLGKDILRILSLHNNYEGKNTIQLMFENGHEDIIADSFKILEKDEYQDIREHLMIQYCNVSLESKLCTAKRKLIRAIERGFTEDVKEILSKAKNSTLSPNESLRILLLSKCLESNTLWIAWKTRNFEIVKELISYAMYMDDGGATLKELLIKPSFVEIHGCGRTHQTVQNLIFEARNNNREHAASILEEFIKQCSEALSPSEDANYLKESLEEAGDITDQLLKSIENTKITF